MRRLTLRIICYRRISFVESTGYDLTADKRLRRRSVLMITYWVVGTRISVGGVRHEKQVSESDICDCKKVLTFFFRLFGKELARNWHLAMGAAAITSRSISRFLKEAITLWPASTVFIDHAAARDTCVLANSKNARLNWWSLSQAFLIN